MDDPRFQKFLSDPRCRNIPKNVRKTKIDKRFQNMFKSKGFKENCKLDERGRKLKLSSAENLKKLYNVASDSSEEDEEENSYNIDSTKERNKNMSKSTEEKASFSLETDSSNEKAHQKKEIVPPLENENSSEDDTSSNEKESLESSSDDSDSGEDSEDTETSDSSEKEFDHHWEELNQEAPDTEEITRRLAVCNMDWDRIRADDLLIVFNSFKPPDTVVHSVKIYPSEFGLKRMEEEKLNGPPELVEEKLGPDEEEAEDKKLAKYHREKLRQYQINRLRYYFGVVDCDTSKTANTLYEELNGMEYESSSVRFDLRFIPDNVTFDQEPSSTSENIPDSGEYKPRLFVTSALQQVKVNLTWDETDPKRRETLQKAFTEPEDIEKDIKDYLASSSSESEEEDEESGVSSTKDRIAKYKALLQSLEDKGEEEKYEMEITWEPGLKEKTEKIVKQKQEETENPFEEILKKERDRKSRKQNKTTNLPKEANDSDPEYSNSGRESDSSISESVVKKDTNRIDELYLLSDARKVPEQSSEKVSKTKKQRNGKKEKLTNFKCDVKDPRFSAIYTSHEYNVDPSDPHFKQTEGSLAIVQEKQNRLKNKESRQNKRFKYN